LELWDFVDVKHFNPFTYHFFIQLERKDLLIASIYNLLLCLFSNLLELWDFVDVKVLYPLVYHAFNTLNSVDSEVA
jgi:hypothetical protein